MGKRRGGTYAVRLLGTPTVEEETKDFGGDGMKASIFYFRNGILAQRRSILFFDGGLPGLQAEVIDSYYPPDDAPVHRGAKLMVRIGDPEPAFREPMSQREKLAREESHETPDEKRRRRHQEDMSHAAHWYAKGIIAGLGPLSPFDEGVDPGLFAEYHVGTWDEKFQTVDESWEIWSEQRRKETGK